MISSGLMLMIFGLDVVSVFAYFLEVQIGNGVAHVNTKLIDSGYGWTGNLRKAFVGVTTDPQF
jgi:hypothetical protein